MKQQKNEGMIKEWSLSWHLYQFQHTLTPGTSDAGRLNEAHLLQDWRKREQLLKEGSKGSLSNCQFYDEVLYWMRALCSLITGITHFYWQGSIYGMILWELYGH